jgi:hypothetical protein
MKKTLLISLAFIANFQMLRSQTIPNASFENWTNMGSYSNPDGWDQLNGYTSLAGIYTCEQGTPGTSGSSYIKLTSKTVTGVGVVPGVAVSGLIDVTTQQAKSGFAYTGQPASLTGKWQHMIFGSSQGFINVKLTKWNSATSSRITVANGNVVLSGMAMSWENFSIPIGYIETFAPDSCIITMSASGSAPSNNDYLWVDELAFAGTVAGIAINNNDNEINLFPNPSSSKLTIDLSLLNTTTAQVMIFDKQGKLVLNLKNVGTQNNMIDVSELAHGDYVLNIISNEGFVSKKFIKN